jgi:hypothetical protein
VQATRRPVKCASCGDVRRSYKRTADGSICRRCYRKQGECTGACKQCSTLAALAKGLCESCILTNHVQVLREFGVPAIVTRLDPYLCSLACSERPRSTLMWMEIRRRLLDELLNGEIALTHEALDEVPGSAHPPRTIAFLRAGLVHAGVLGKRDEVLTAFTKWVEQTVSVLDKGPDRALVHAYATWHVARGLSQRTKTGRPATRHCRSLVIEAINITRWLHAQELTLSDLHQDLTDQWVAGGNSRRRWVRLFLIWLKRTGTTGELHVAKPEAINRTIPLADIERMKILTILLNDTQLDPRDRLAGSLLLLYAQPLSDLALELRERAGDSQWLFPGRHPGRHLSPDHLRKRLKDQGITSCASRHGALLALAMRLPAPILAERFGFHQARTARWVRAAGATYAEYVALRATQ